MKLTYTKDQYEKAGEKITAIQVAMEDDESLQDALRPVLEYIDSIIEDRPAILVAGYMVWTNDKAV